MTATVLSPFFTTPHVDMAYWHICGLQGFDANLPLSRHTTSSWTVPVPDSIPPASVSWIGVLQSPTHRMQLLQNGHCNAILKNDLIQSQSVKVKSDMVSLRAAGCRNQRSFQKKGLVMRKSTNIHCLKLFKSQLATETTAKPCVVSVHFWCMVDRKMKPILLKAVCSTTCMQSPARQEV